MRNLLLTLATGTLVLASSQAKAIVFTDFESINTELNAGGPQSSFSGTFNIAEHGFVPGYHYVWQAGITFWLVDDDLDRAQESFTINLDGTYSSSQFTSFLVVGTTQVGIDLLTSLNADGILTYNVSATSGDFWLMSAALYADATVSASENRVPESGSTMILGACALGALALVQRQLLKRAA